MIGTQIGSYRIDEKLGEGGMGTVYRATEVNLERTVAIKVLNKDLAGKPAIVERFRTEAKAQANLNHHNIATLYAFLLEHDNAMMVMEYVDGENFQQLVNRRGAIHSSEAVPLFKQALAGIGAAHEMGIVHRDIKPANIMLNQRGVVKVMDFGIAKVMGERGLTRTGVQLGTVFYMSPEQVKGQTADIRSDVYALGVTLYELLTAHVPFNSNSEYAILTDHVSTAPPLPSTHNSNIPKGIENIVLKALEKRPEDRFQSVAEFSYALDHPEQWEQFVPKSAMVILPGMAPTMEIPVQGTGAQTFNRPSPNTTLPPPPPPSSWTPIRMGIAAFGVILIAGIAGLVVYTRRQPQTPAPVEKPAQTTAASTTPAEPPPPPPLAPMTAEARGEKAPAVAPDKEPAQAAKPEAKKEAAHLTIPAKSVIHVRLTGPIEGSAANESQTFPVVFAETFFVGERTVAPKGAGAHVVLTKMTGSKKSPKAQFQLADITVAGKTYEVRSDTFEFNNEAQGKRAGKFSALRSIGKHGEGSIELPADSEMFFSLKAAIPVTLP